jgi:hypothetical protein
MAQTAQEPAESYIPSMQGQELPDSTRLAWHAVQLVLDTPEQVAQLE